MERYGRYLRHEKTWRYYCMYEAEKQPYACQIFGQRNRAFVDIAYPSSVAVSQSAPTIKRKDPRK